MKFRVSGLDRDSGEVKVLTFDAADERAAREWACKKAVVVEKIEPLRDENAQSVATTKDAEELLLRREYKRLTQAELSIMGTLRGLAGLLVAVGLIMMYTGYQPTRIHGGYYPENLTIGGYSSKRFKTDNAHGATANATEYIADNIGRVNTYYKPTSMMGSVILLAGVVLLIPAELIRQRGTLRHYGDQLVARRDRDHPT